MPDFYEINSSHISVFYQKKLKYEKRTNSGPISRSVSFRLAGQSMTGGGFQHNSKGYGNANIGALRGKIRWKIDETSTLDIGGHWTTDQSESSSGHNLYNSYGVPITSDIMETAWGLDPRFAKIIGIDGNNKKPREDNMFWGANVRYTKDFSWGRFWTLSAFETVDEHELTNQTNSVASYGNMFRNNQTNVFSQEVKLESLGPVDKRFNPKPRGGDIEEAHEGQGG
ncbi:hypothetical protein JK181_13650, partial [Gluconobacter kondonii]|nr:hypothetical protein [Gluconobacter kondonii]